MRVNHPRQPGFLTLEVDAKSSTNIRQNSPVVTSRVNVKSSTNMRQNSAVATSRVEITPRDVGLNEADCD